MRLIAIGRSADVRGFALAGVETARCETHREIEAALQSLATDPTVGLVMVPDWAERAAPDSIARVRRTRGAPVILVLPGDPGSVN